MKFEGSLNNFGNVVFATAGTRTLCKPLEEECFGLLFDVEQIITPFMTIVLHVSQEHEYQKHLDC